MSKVSKQVAVNSRLGQTFHHIKLRNADGTPVRCRVNGKCKTWKTRPDEFRLPVKYGIRDYFYIDETTCLDWTTEPTC